MEPMETSVQMWPWIVGLLFVVGVIVIGVAVYRWMVGRWPWETACGAACNCTGVMPGCSHGAKCTCGTPACAPGAPDPPTHCTTVPPGAGTCTKALGHVGSHYHFYGFPSGGGHCF